MQKTKIKQIKLGTKLTESHVLLKVSSVHISKIKKTKIYIKSKCY